MRKISPLRPVLLLVSAAAVLTGCAQRPAIVVVVPDVPEQTATLHVRASAGQLTAQESPQFDVTARAMGADKPFAFSFGLHPPQSVTGTLSVGVAAFDAAGCLLTSGANDLVIDPTQSDLGLEVQLDLTQLGTATPCKSATPALQSVVQPDDDPTTLQLVGWGFDPAAQVFVDGQAVSQTQVAHWDRMVVTPTLVQSPTGGKPVTVMVRNPDGSQDSMMLFLKTVLFKNPSKYSITLDATYTPYTVRVADLNKDGTADVAVSGQSGAAAGFIAIFLNPGDGHLPSTPLILNLPSIVESLELADMDNDGARDLIVSTGMPSPGITVFHNPGNGQFSATNKIVNTCNGTPDSIAVADLNGSSQSVQPSRRVCASRKRARGRLALLLQGYRASRIKRPATGG